MKKQIKLKESTYILKETDDIYQVIFTSTRRIKRFGVDNLVKDIIENVKHEHNLDNLLENLKKKHPEKEIVSCISTLEQAGVLSIYDEQKVNERHRKQILFLDELTNNYSETLALQKKLENSVIAVFGIGGIGTWIVNGLHQIGIGTIKIVDFDIVTESNLNRQLYFTSQDVSKYKVDVIKDKLSDGNIQPFKRKVSEEEDLSEIISGCDFLVNCADSPSIADTSKIINTYSKKFNIPYCIGGGYNLHLGMVGPIIVPSKTACLDCFLEHQKENDTLSKLEKIKDIEQTGSLGPIAGVIANLQVMEIFKYLTGKGTVNFNRFAEIEFMNFGIEWRNYEKRADCKTCNNTAE